MLLNVVSFAMDVGGAFEAVSVINVHFICMVPLLVASLFRPKTRVKVIEIIKTTQKLYSEARGDQHQARRRYRH